MRLKASGSGVTKAWQLLGVLWVLVLNAGSLLGDESPKRFLNSFIKAMQWAGAGIGQELVRGCQG